MVHSISPSKRNRDTVIDPIHKKKIIFQVDSLTLIEEPKGINRNEFYQNEQEASVNYKLVV